MGRGVSSGGGQSSLGYLFGSSEAPKPVPTANETSAVKNAPSAKQVGNNTQGADVTKQVPSLPAVPAGTTSNCNNYFRAEGQNCGNFITDRPSTKVHAAPGGGSSLDYLFGGSGGGGN